VKKIKIVSKISFEAILSASPKKSIYFEKMRLKKPQKI